MDNKYDLDEDLIINKLEQLSLSDFDYLLDTITKEDL